MNSNFKKKGQKSLFDKKAKLPETALDFSMWDKYEALLQNEDYTSETVLFQDVVEDIVASEEELAARSSFDESILGEMDKIFRKNIESRIPPVLRLFVLSQCVDKLSKIANFDQMILEINFKYQPITLLTTLRQYQFKSYYPFIICKWLEYRLHLTEENIYRKFYGFLHWDKLVARFDTLLYPIFVGNNIVEKKIHNFQDYILNQVQEYHHIIHHLENENIQNIVQIWKIPSNLNQKRYGRMVKDLLQEASEDTKLKIHLGESMKIISLENETLSLDLSQDGSKKVLASEYIRLICDIMGDERSYFDGLENVSVECRKYEILESLYLQYENIWAPEMFVIGSEEVCAPFFSIFQTSFRIREFIDDLFNFMQLEIFFSSGSEYWNGTQWMDKLQYLNNFKYMSGLHSSKSIQMQASLLESYNKDVNCMVNVFNTGIAYYPLFNSFEISNPGQSVVTRVLDNIIVSDDVIYYGASTKMKGLLQNQLMSIIKFTKLIDTISICGTILYHPSTRYNFPLKKEDSNCLKLKYFEEVNTKNSEIPINQQIFLSSIQLLPKPIIQKFFDFFCECQSDFISDLLNISITCSTKFLDLKNFQKLFFDQNAWWTKELGIPIDVLLENNNKSDLKIGDNEQSFLNSMKVISDKLLSKIENLKVIETKTIQNIETKITAATNYYLKYSDKNQLEILSRIKCFSLMKEYRKFENKKFDFKTVPYNIIFKIVEIVLFLLRSRPKKVEKDHDLFGTSIDFFLQSYDEINRALRIEFKYIPINLNSTTERVNLMISWCAWRKAKNRQPRIDGFLYWRETLHALSWLFHFCIFDIPSLDTIGSFVKSIEFPSNWTKQFLFIFGSSSSSKSKLNFFLTKIFKCTVSAILSEAALKTEENELNSAIIPLEKNLLCVVDEIKEMHATKINKIISEFQLSSRKMHTQQTNSLQTNAKLILVTNSCDIKSNQGFVTRLIGIWMKMNFRQVNEDGDWGKKTTVDTAVQNWCIQRCSNIFATGFDENKITLGLFLVIRHLFVKYQSLTHIVKIITSDLYKKDTLALLNHVDSYYKYLFLLNSEYKYKPKPTPLENVEYINEKYNIKWSVKNKNSIVNRILEDQRNLEDSSILEDVEM